ncbi:MBL fold metallo-hydrolase [Pseudoalteromonas sp. SR43-7]|uniref:MBL fold metallo-hydrolase n=1 Tax=Pseudoalteromonas sp. SR43-7 TaxID=2760939 RepID=UPI0015FD9DB5|nr:MBL fold metallo-hydrolase [Pseudoalteromonas sp. SR43-7]MBB1328209.1 MBL fold metallo-hydrolase [Pseudoalteromonas sp. SR43-7]
MKVEFFGVRGSMPSAGSNTNIFGGNTSCVYIEQNNGKDLILDSGTGIVELGTRLLETQSPINILLTHNHWDHIQGFPFFKPIYQPNRNITIVAGNVDDKKSQDAILKQMSGSYFPVCYQDLPASIKLNTDLSSQKQFTLNGFLVSTAPLNHPGGGTAYCIKADEKKIAYVTDNELNPPDKLNTSICEWVNFIEGADLLIHDAQFIDADLPLKHGWGHSTIDQVAELAIKASIKNVIIISHDPSRTDEQLLAIEKYLHTQYAQQVKIECGREGRVFDF